MQSTSSSSRQPASLPQAIVGFIRQHPAAIVIGLLIIIFCFHFATLLNYPKPGCDESFYGRTALLYTQAIQDGEAWPPPGVLFFVPHGRSYWLILSGAFALLGQTLFAARLVSLAGLIALTAATYAVGALYVSRKTGAWSAILVSLTWLSLFAGHYARPDILAGAAVTATIALLQLTLTRQKTWLYIAFGLAVALQLDVHLNLVHFVLPILAVVAARFYQQRAFRPALWVGLGLTVGAVIVGIIHLGSSLEVATTVLTGNPITFIDSYGGSSSSPGFTAIIAESISSFANFWWTYYAWQTPLLSLPQAGLFVLGLANALVSRDYKLRALAVIIILSSLTYAVVNRNYQLLGYSILWLPLYIVLGVAALEQLALRLTRRRKAPINVASIALTLLAVLYATGDIYLVRMPLTRIYEANAQATLNKVKPGARVLTGAMWWYSMKDRVVFLDDTLVAPPGSNLWWQSPMKLTADEVEAALEIDAPNRTVVSVAEQLAMLKPDYIIDDNRIGCNRNPDSLSLALTDYVSRNYRLIGTNSSEFGGDQSIYAAP